MNATRWCVFGVLAGAFVLPLPSAAQVIPMHHGGWEDQLVQGNDWAQVYETDERTVVVYQSAVVTGSSGIRYALERSEYRDRTNKAYSMTIHATYDCVRMRTRLGRPTIYSKHNLGGTARAFPDEGDWEKVDAGSYGSFTFTRACLSHR